MLKVVNMSNSASCEPVIFFEHVLSVRFLSVEGTVPLYWRTGDFKYSLLEVGILESTGQCIDITLVTANLVYEVPTVSLTFCDHAGIANGVPTVDLKRWQPIQHYRDTIYDDPDLLRVELAADAVRIIIGGNASVSQCFRCGNVYVGIDEQQHLHIVELTQLSQDIVAKMKERYKL